MSTYGTAFVVDVPTGSRFSPPQEVRSSLVGGFATVAGDGWSRICALVSEIEVVDALVKSLIQVGHGRIAIAEDNDEFGARWVVGRVEGGQAEVVHRRYVLNADPDDEEQVEEAISSLEVDPRTDDVAGIAAAAAAATLFAVAPDAMVDAERESESAWEEIGFVGGPFPWWDALELPWPVPVAGEPLDW